MDWWSLCVSLVLVCTVTGQNVGPIPSVVQPSTDCVNKTDVMRALVVILRTMSNLINAKDSEAKANVLAHVKLHIDNISEKSNFDETFRNIKILSDHIENSTQNSPEKTLLRENQEREIVLQPPPFIVTNTIDSQAPLPLQPPISPFYQQEQIGCADLYRKLNTLISQATNKPCDKKHEEEPIPYAPYVLPKSHIESIQFNGLPYPLETPGVVNYQNIQTVPQPASQLIANEVTKQTFVPQPISLINTAPVSYKHVNLNLQNNDIVPNIHPDLQPNVPNDSVLADVVKHYVVEQTPVKPVQFETQKRVVYVEQNPVKPIQFETQRNVVYVDQNPIKPVQFDTQKKVVFENVQIPPAPVVRAVKTVQASYPQNVPTFFPSLPFLPTYNKEVQLPPVSGLPNLQDVRYTNLYANVQPTVASLQPDMVAKNVTVTKTFIEYLKQPNLPTVGPLEQTKIYQYLPQNYSEKPSVRSSTFPALPPLPPILPSFKPPISQVVQNRYFTIPVSSIPQNEFSSQYVNTVPIGSESIAQEQILPLRNLDVEVSVKPQPVNTAFTNVVQPFPQSVYPVPTPAVNYPFLQNYKLQSTYQKSYPVPIQANTVYSNLPLQQYPINQDFVNQQTIKYQTPNLIKYPQFSQQQVDVIKTPTLVQYPQFAQQQVETIKTPLVQYPQFAQQQVEAIKTPLVQYPQFAQQQIETINTPSLVQYPQYSQQQVDIVNKHIPGSLYSQRANYLQKLLELQRLRNLQMQPPIVPQYGASNAYVPGYTQPLGAKSEDYQWSTANNLYKSNVGIDSNGMIELTYLLNHPVPVTVTQPYLLVKYKLPLDTFKTNLRSLLLEKPQLRTNPSQLYKELATHWNVSHQTIPNSVPDTIDGEDINKLVAKQGSLVKAKLVASETQSLTTQNLAVPNVDVQNLGAQKLRAQSLDAQVNKIKALNSKIEQSGLLQENSVQRNSVKVSGPTENVATKAEIIKISDVKDTRADNNLNVLSVAHRDRRAKKEISQSELKEIIPKEEQKPVLPSKGKFGPNVQP